MRTMWFLWIFCQASLSDRRRADGGSKSQQEAASRGGGGGGGAPQRQPSSGVSSFLERSLHQAEGRAETKMKQPQEKLPVLRLRTEEEKQETEPAKERGRVRTRRKSPKKGTIMMKTQNPEQQLIQRVLTERTRSQHEEITQKKIRPNKTGDRTTGHQVGRNPQWVELVLVLLEVLLPVKGEFSSPLSLHACSV
ncbi:uncharacterized protein LOC118566627 isoform X2 [Fundulus heteroclitus]|uniref:uncharacterized protein LOC118566627 isoform X2 n=1 Tax=Fundulus heteroclitus TaxID=8078 RepID=UPI00165C7454|nr:uncharacterized protein LOC118566627 isoform X2 [Fundulus heteroclitus]